MGKTFRHGNKYYDDDSGVSRKQKFSERRAKKLRKIVDKTEKLSDNYDGEATDRNIPGTHV